MKRAILAVSFGTTYPDTRAQTIDATVAMIQAAFPEVNVEQAYTSNIVRQRIAKTEGLMIPAPADALRSLALQGYQDVIVMSLHLLPGVEYELLQQSVAANKSRFTRLTLTPPLLTSYEDFVNLVHFMQALSLGNQVEGILWMGHGSKYFAFTSYACLDHMLLGTPSYVAAVESYPKIEPTVSRMVQAGLKRVYLHPLMLVAGNHAHHDMVAADPHSWQSQLGRAGIEAIPVMKGLGAYPEVQKMFLSKLEAVL